MRYRNHCNTLAVTHYTGGQNRAISELLREGAHRIEAWGNKREGFTAYLVSDAGGTTSGVSISSGFYTLRRDLVDACKRAYGSKTTIKAGRNW